MKENPVPAESFDIVKIKGSSDTFRIRIGDIRIVYQVLWGEGKVRIALIEFRGRAYK
jgi:mRNA interferase RelE/StbE